MDTYFSSILDKKAKEIEVIFKNCAPFTNCINEIINKKTDNAKDLVLLCHCII